MDEDWEHQEKSLGLAEVLVPPGWEEEMLHLLECPKCRTVMATRLRDLSLMGSAGGEEYAPALQELELRLPGFLRVFEERGAEVDKLYERLLAAGQEERRVLVTRPEYRSLRLAERLLQGSQAARSMTVAREHAELALLIAGQFQGPEEDEAADVRVLGWSFLADLERREGRWATAEWLFAEVSELVGRVEESPERVSYCRFLAHLRRDQDRLDEAAGLLWRGGVLANQMAEARLAARCFVELGFLLLEGEPDLALAPLRHAQLLFDREDEVGLAVASRYGLALAYAAAGRRDEAFHMLKEGSARLRGVEPVQDVRRVLALEGKALVLLGDPLSGAHRLDRARLAHLAAGDFDEAGMTVVDVVTARREAGLAVETEELLKDFAAPPEGARDRARLQVLEHFLASAAAGGSGEELNRRAVTAKRRLRRLKAEPEAVLAELAKEAA